MLVKISSAAALGIAASFMAVVAAPPAAAAPQAITASARIGSVSPDSVTVLWQLDLADGWHVYGPFRNDTGYPPRIRLDLPAGWTADPPRWPVPERYVTADEILDHVYHDALVLPQTLHRPSGHAGGEIRARIEWLACRQICVPGDTTFVVTIADQADPEAARDLAAALAAVPGPLPPGLAQIQRTDAAVEIVVPGARSITVVPGPDGPFFVDLIADGQVAGERLTLRLRSGSAPREPLAVLLTIDHNNMRKTTGSIVIQ